MRHHAPDTDAIVISFRASQTATVLLADATSRPGAIKALINEVKLAIHDQYLKIVLKLYFHMRSHFSKSRISEMFSRYREYVYLAQVQLSFIPLMYHVYPSTFFDSRLST